MIDEAVKRRIENEADTLPVLPRAVGRVIELISDPGVSAEAVAQVVVGDVALAAKVLRLANSTYYGFPRRVGSIREAVIILGTRALREVVMAAGAHGFLSRELPGYMLKAGELWQHSICAAMAAARLATRSTLVEEGDAFTAGLVHDVGKLVLAKHVGERYQEVLRGEEGLPFLEIERRLFGTDHAEVGAMIARRWSLPGRLEEAIASHHDPGQAKLDPALAALTHVADWVAMMLGQGVGADGLAYRFDPAAISSLGLDEAEILRVAGEVADLSGSIPMQI